MQTLQVSDWRGLLVRSALCPVDRVLWEGVQCIGPRMGLVGLYHTYFNGMGMQLYVFRNLRKGTFNYLNLPIISVSWEVFKPATPQH